jgi:uncharacterized membrane protein YphA (DoxX/SURF4 family)
MLDALTDPYVQLVLRLVVGGLLLYAGVSKLTDRPAFQQAVAEYDVLPAGVARAFSNALPALETLLGVLLLAGFGTGIAAAIAVPLFASFALAIGVNMARGRHFDCHCFGSTRSDEIGWTAFLRALALAVAALIVAAGASRFGALEYALFGSGESLPPVADVIPTVLVAAVVFDVLFLLPETLSLQAAFRRMRANNAAAAAGHTHERATPIVPIGEIR